MNKREQKTHLKRVLGCYLRGAPANHNARVLTQAVFWANRYGLELPADFAEKIWAKVSGLLYESKCEPCRIKMIERHVDTAGWNAPAEGCYCLLAE